jgi:hypothetical protein
LTFSQSRPAADPLSDVASRSLKAHPSTATCLSRCWSRRPIAPDSSVPPEASFPRWVARRNAKSELRFQCLFSSGACHWRLPPPIIAKEFRGGERRSTDYLAVPDLSRLPTWIAIRRIEGKWNVSQNRPVADREGVVAGLRAQNGGTGGGADRKIAGLRDSPRPRR